MKICCLSASEMSVIYGGNEGKGGVEGGPDCDFLAIVSRIVSGVAPFTELPALERIGCEGDSK